jgi:hypothetical protein
MADAPHCRSDLLHHAGGMRVAHYMHQIQSFFLTFYIGSTSLSGNQGYQADQE